VDFLFLAFYPPDPLGVVITPGVLNKFRRIARYLLRLLRVEAALRDLWTDLHQPSPIPSSRGPRHAPLGQAPLLPVFHTKVRARRQIHVLAFQLRHFVGALSSFAWDVAIQANWSRLIEVLGKMQAEAERAERDNEADEWTEAEHLQSHNIDSLFARLSHTLELMLYSLLLKRRQVPVARVVTTSVLEVALDLAKLVTQMTRGEVDEEEGEKAMLELKSKLGIGIATLVRPTSPFDHLQKSWET
jgi:Gamma tubulin complex component C-terminal